MIHALSKPPLSLRLSVTDRCQLRCRYCMPAEGVVRGLHEDVLRYEEMVVLIELLRQHFDVQKVRLTGGDPLARVGLDRLVAMLARLGIPDLALTTNGQNLARMAVRLGDAGLNRVNISLDSLQRETFRILTRGGDLRHTLAGIDAARAAGLFPVKLNAVVIQGVNDHEVCNLLSYALDHGCELRFLELMPIGEGALLFERGFIDAATVRDRLATQFSLSPLPRVVGVTAQCYRAVRADGATGVVGFISPCSDAFCSDCTRLRITSDGRLLGCLARREGVTSRPFLQTRDAGSLAAVVEHAMRGKRSGCGFEQPALMVGIGG